MLKKIRIGDILLQNNVITQEQLDQAVILQNKGKKRLGEALVELKLISEVDLSRLLAEQLNIPIIDLATYAIEPKIASQLPEVYAIRYQCIILKKTPDGFLVGMTDPMDIFAYDEISRILKSSISVALVKKSDLEKKINVVYRRDTEITNFASELGVVLDKEVGGPDALLPAQLIDAPVKKFINALFEDAVHLHASDIHIEPDATALRIRLRVDGVLQEQVLDQKNIAPAITQHIKLMANLNIAEKRLPQDGRFSLGISNKMIDARLSTMPIEHGESVVIRLLDQSTERVILDQCGMPDDMLIKFRQLVHAPNGVILVTGPTGSGKTTTLYAALSELNSSEKKIITIEDPVEYQLERICQVQVKPKIGLDFARVLRSILRQDPDIILVGEMRDNETASIAIRAALTGHLVLSTLHTNDAASTAIRLLDMGLPGYIVAATLQGVVAQRLIRKNCDRCREVYELSVIEKEWLARVAPPEMSAKTFYFGKGCNHCANIGYSGRIGIYECLIPTPDMISALVSEDQMKFLNLARVSMKGQSLLDQALSRALDGLTNISEVIRISGENY
jgi:MSHA biogenesis protein MshE